MTDDKVMKNAQYRKGLGIAWFNATNSAIEMVKVEFQMGLAHPVDKFSTKATKISKKKVKIERTYSSMEERISYWRNKFLEDHKEYYANVIAQVGATYDTKKTIEIIKTTKNRAELKLVWNAMSEDERHDGEIRKLVKELKAKFK